MNFLLEVPTEIQYTDSMKNKKEIQTAIIAAYDAIGKVQDLLTPDVIEWAYKDGFDSDDEVAVEIVNFGQNLIDIGNEIDGE